MYGLSSSFIRSKLIGEMDISREEAGEGLGEIPESSDLKSEIRFSGSGMIEGGLLNTRLQRINRKKKRQGSASFAYVFGRGTQNQPVVEGRKTVTIKVIIIQYSCFSFCRL
jgi:hypothetical protein